MIDDPKDIENALRAYGDRIRFRRKLNSIHADLDMDTMRVEADAYRSNAEPSGRIRSF